MESEKKSGLIKFNLLLVLVFLMMACDKDAYDAPEEQPVFFEYHYMNHAWGVQDHGWLLDQHGNIRRFDFPENYNSVIHGDFLSLEQLEHNLGQADSVVGEVNANKLEKQVRLIQGASEGEITRIHWQGADMGLGVYSCYKYDAEQNAYQFILLSADGDYQQYNQSSEAEKLSDWLKEVFNSNSI
jgi:hypothetical protein